MKMLYLCNLYFSIFVLALSVVYVIYDVFANKQSMFYWVHSICDAGTYCQEAYFNGMPPSNDPEFLELLKMDMVPPPVNPDTTGFDINEPAWKTLTDYFKVQEQIKRVYDGQPPGTFVEVGAADGYFMSQTLYLEKNLSWNGLLIEPDPRAFEAMVARRRNAWLSPHCVDIANIGKRFWMRKLEPQLPQYFQDILRARNRLYDDILIGDDEKGTSIWVTCATLSAILRAVNVSTVDLLSINTGSESNKDKIMSAVRNKDFNVKAILIHYPNVVLSENEFPYIPGYILSVTHSNILVKFYVKRSYCKYLKYECQIPNYFDKTKACHQYFCFRYLNVWTNQKF